MNPSDLKKIIGNRKIVWKAQPGQALPFMVPWEVREILLTGPRGGGKTTCLFAAWQRGIGLGMGMEWKGMIFKRTNTEVLTLGDEAKKFFLALDPNVKCTTHPYYTFVWPTGEKLTLRHMADVNDYDGIHGSQLTFIGWEELTNWALPDVYLKCMSLLRSSDPRAGRMSQVWATTNPGQIGNNWVRDRWQLPQMMNKIISENNAEAKELERWSRDKLVMMTSGKRIAINLDVRKNKALLDVVPDYLAQIAAQATSDAQRRQWLDGDWTTTAGGMFNDIFHFKHHIFDRFPIPRGWTISRGMDWGSSTPFSILWFAISDGSDFVDAEGRWRSSVRGDVFIIHEWYGSSGGINKGLFLTAPEVAYGIIEREMEWGIYNRVVPGPADNQIMAQFQAGQSIAKDMESPIRLPDGREVKGVSWTRSDKNSGGGTRVTGWNLIRNRLKRALPEQNLKSPRELPSLYFFHDLPDLIKHFPNTPRDEKVIDDVPKRGEFHCQDTLRYIILDQGEGMSQGSVVGLH